MLTLKGGKNMLTPISCIYIRIWAFPIDQRYVSSHFYYQAAQWQCHNMIDMLANNELSDTAYKDDLRANTNTFEFTTTIAVPLNVVQLVGGHQDTHGQRDT